MDRETLRALVRGPFCTVPTAFDANLQLDLGKMAELTRWWVAEGVVTGQAVLKVAAALGEGPDLSDDEWPRLLETVTKAADGRATIVCGLKTKNTLHTIDDAKRAHDLGATAVQVDLPFFHHPTADDIVRYFSDISEAIEIGVIIYNTWWFGALSLTPAIAERLYGADRIIGIKWAVPPESDYDDMRHFAEAINVIDNSNEPVRCHANGGAGYINNTMSVYPAHDLQLWRLIEDRHYEEAQALFDRVNRPLERFMTRSAQRSGGYRTNKALMQLAGRAVGDPRPPTLPLDDGELKELQTLMESFGWPIAIGGGDSPR